jgi:ribosomal protein L17
MQAAAFLTKPEALGKLFEKLGARKGDSAETAKLELVGSELVKPRRNALCDGKRS